MATELDNCVIPCVVPGTFLREKQISNGVTRYRAINYLFATVTFLNFSGFKLFKLLDGTKSILDLGKKIAADNGIEIDPILDGLNTFIRHLKEQKLIYLKGEDPPNILETTFMNHPQEIWLSVTGKCNLQCITCFKDKIYGNEMSTKKLLRTIDEIEELGIGYIVVSGGEPFMRPDILDVLEYISQKNISILIITNGTLIDEEIAKRLGEIRPKIVQVSLDGSNAKVNDRIRGKGVYDKTIRAAKFLIEQDLDVRLYPTITRLNIHDLPNMRELVRELRPGYNHFAFAKFHPTGRGLENKEELYIPEDEFLEIMSTPQMAGCADKSSMEAFNEIYNSANDMDLTELLPRRVPYGARKINCGLGTATLSIEADGKVYPCHWLHSPEYMAGDLNKQGLEEIYFSSEVFARFRMLRVDSNIEGCHGCDYKYFCGGGCRARGMFDTGKIEGRDPHCNYLYSHFDCGFWTERLFTASNKN